MEILLYGGCHADIFYQYMRKYTIDKDVNYSFIRNYEIIGRNEPFPYDSLGQYDAVVFSPIVNKRDYNTDNLIEICAQKNIKTIAYPWLQWNGYFPGLIKTKSSDWMYSPMITNRTRYNNFEEYYSWIENSMVHRDDIINQMANTTHRLKDHEESNNVDIKITPFIEENYRNVRLFQTPDHPTTFTYQYVIKEIATRLNINISELFYLRKIEFQPEIKIPILPVVKSALDLHFDDCDYVRQDKFDNHVLDLLDLSKIVFHAGLNRFIAISDLGKSEVIGRLNFELPTRSYVIFEKIGDNVKIIDKPSCKIRYNADVNYSKLINRDLKEVSINEYAEE